MPDSPKQPAKPAAATRVKRPTKALAKAPAKAPAKTLTKAPVKTSAPAGKPFLRFYHSDALRAKTLTLLSTLEKADDAKQHRDALADLVSELTDSGLDYYFIRSLKLAKAGFFAEQSANLGIGAAKRVFASVIRN